MLRDEVESERQSDQLWDANCRFCRMIHGEAECHAVQDDPLLLTFLDERPLFPGHCLIIPKSHYETLIDVPARLLEPLFAMAQMVARALQEVMLAEGTFVAINNHVSQSVPHLHIHVVPRRKQDGLKGFFWPRHMYRDQEHLLHVQRTLRDAIDDIRRRG